MTPEHLSRLESGAKVIQSNTEKQLRTLVVALACGATKAKDETLAEFSKKLPGIFDNIQACRSVDREPVMLHLRHAACAENDLVSEGLWDQDVKVA